MFLERLSARAETHWKLQDFLRLRANKAAVIACSFQINAEQEIKGERVIRGVGPEHARAIHSERGNLRWVLARREEARDASLQGMT